MFNYPFIKNDCNKKFSKRPKQDNDCTVIALGIACNISYDRSYNILKFFAKRKCNRAASYDKCLKKLNKISLLPYKFNWIPFPAIKGQKRMTPIEFIKKYPKGVYIIETARHVFAMKDGIALGTWQERENRCIYGVWEVVKNPLTFSEE